MDGDLLLHRNCPRCGRGNEDTPVLSYSWEHWRLRECAGCDFVYLENPPDYAGLVVEFAWERNHGDRAVRMRRDHPVTFALSRAWRKVRRTLIRKPDKFANRVRAWIPAGRVIEVGCGNADRLAVLPDQYETVGVEISDALAEEAMRMLGPRRGSVIKAPALEGISALEEESVSGVLMRSFLEHEHAPGALLSHTARVLEPGGGVLIKVPNYASINRRVMGKRWCGFRFPGHVNYFTPDSLAEMVHATGLEIVQFGFFDRFPLSDNMWLVARKPV